MKKPVEERFNDIVQGFLQEMAMEKCSQMEYVSGLESAIEEIQVSIQAAKETLRDPEQD